MFEGDSNIEALFIQNSVNNKNLPKFLENIIRIHDDAIIPGVTNFRNKVFFLATNLEAIHHESIFQI